MAKKVISIVLVLIWMGIIFSMSCSNGEHSGGMSRKVIVIATEVLTDIKDGTEDMDRIVDKYQFVVRKGAHFTEYFILGILALLCFKEYGVKNIYLVILFCFIYAITDEIHQLFVIGRSGEVKDIILDTIGSTIGIFIYYLYKSKTEVTK